MQLALVLLLGPIETELVGRVPGEFDALWTKTGVEVSTLTLFVPVRILGSGVITVIGTTEYSQNGGAYTVAPGVIVTEDIIRIRYTSSASFETEVVGGVVIDGVNCNASLTTKAGNTWDDISGNPILDINGNPIEVF